MKKTRVSERLGIEVPIIQASMTWVTSAELAAAVSNAGGLGVLGPNAGQTTLTQDPVETAERLRREIWKTRGLTDKPFAVNYLMPDPNIPFTLAFAESIYKVLCEEKVEIILASGGFSENEIMKMKDQGFIVIYRDVNPTVETAQKAENAGADMLIATGYDAGGHMSEHAIGTFTMVPTIVDAVSIPVVAAGGIVDQRGMKAVFLLGAEGIYVGTRFIASVECPADIRCKEAIQNGKLKDLVEFKAMVGSLRCTPNKVALKCVELAEQGASRQEIASVYGNGFKTGMLEGNLDEGIVSVSNSIDMINDIKTCQEIIEAFTAGIE